MLLRTTAIDLNLPDTPEGRGFKAWIEKLPHRCPLHIRISGTVTTPTATTDCGSLYLGPDALILALWATEPYRSQALRLTRLTDRDCIRQEILGLLSSSSSPSTPTP